MKNGKTGMRKWAEVPDGYPVRRTRVAGGYPAKRQSLPAGYTVEAAGVMAVLLVTIMILMNQAFRIHAETAGKFSLHEAVEQKRHAVEQISEREVTMETQGRDWKLEITAPVFRPEETLRLWSLTEGRE